MAHCGWAGKAPKETGILIRGGNRFRFRRVRVTYVTILIINQLGLYQLLRNQINMRQKDTNASSTLQHH
jgi:hypothetical protein